VYQNFHWAEIQPVGIHMDLHADKILKHARRQWLTPVILAAQEAEIRRITV
jgi:hypothetical protein